MKKSKNFKGKSILLFILKTLAYFAILMGLIYLYHYTGIDSTGFIYNEF